MTTLRCLLVDDERLARLELSALLDEAGGCTVVAEAANVDEALRLIPRHHPDVIFLDINMPGANGFDLLAKLEDCPPVVFVTAYDQYAVDAFAVRALDYLLKPVRPDRLADTLNLLRGRVQLPAERIFVSNRNGGRFIDPVDVFLVRAYDHYVRLYHSGGSDLLPQAFGVFVAGLPAADYFRANRSEMIRLQAVEKVEKRSRGRLEVWLKGGERVVVSERRSIVWRRRFES